MDLKSNVDFSIFDQYVEVQACFGYPTFYFSMEVCSLVTVYSLQFQVCGWWEKFAILLELYQNPHCYYIVFFSFCATLNFFPNELPWSMLAFNRGFAGIFCQAQTLKLWRVL